ncbi:MAG: tetratricopeptide repeat protein [Planktomarina sp.]
MKRHLCALIIGLIAQTATADTGAYLAGRQAILGHDYQQAVGYLSSALLRDPSNAQLQLLTMQSNLALGNLDQAIEIGSWLETSGAETPLAALVLLAGDMKAGDYPNALARLDAETVAGGAMDALIRGWAHMGLGEVSKALLVFDDAADSGGIRAFALTHKALALASVGDFEQARVIIEGDADTPGIAMTERATLAYAQILVQLDEGEQARDLLQSRFIGTDNEVALSYARSIEAGATLNFDFVTSPTQGVSEVFYTVARALQREQDPDLLLLYTRLAHALSDRHVDALLLSAAFLEELENPSLAIDAYDQVPRNHPAYLRAELGRAAALEDIGQADTAVEVLSQLTEAYPDVRRVHMALGDLLRREENYAAAQLSYDRIIDGIVTAIPQDWFVFFARGVTLHKQDKWEAAETDMRRAITLDGKQGSVLNYLGYSLVDQGIDLEEGLALIERADTAQPGQGHIIDSLGWAHFQLGNFVVAVQHLERAVESMPTDPTINDHLGDAYWMVGRKVEAEFQWRRALSFDPGPEDASVISDKLENGLKTVSTDADMVANDAN